MTVIFKMFRCVAYHTKCRNFVKRNISIKSCNQSQIEKFRQYLSLPVIPYPISNDRQLPDRRWFILKKKDKKLACLVNEEYYDFRIHQFLMDYPEYFPRRYIYCRDFENGGNYHFTYDNKDGAKLATIVSDRNGCSGKEIEEVNNIIRNEFGGE